MKTSRTSHLEGQVGSIRKRLKNVAGSKADDVVSYGSRSHPNDPDRKVMLINFYLNDSLQEGKAIVDAALANDSSKYVQNFRQVVFDPPSDTDRSALTRYKRRVLLYKALLVKAGFELPADPPSVRGLFSQDIRTALTTFNGQPTRPEYQSAARVVSLDQPSWPNIATAAAALAEFVIEGRGSPYEQFELQYVAQSTSGERWADDDLRKILEMHRYANGSRLIGRVRNQHSAEVTTDYADAIVADLLSGRLVIVDQSAGDPEVNRLSSDRIMRAVFVHNQELFRAAQTPPDILIYVEEAHNLLPDSSDDDLTNIWVRAAKEGAKYRIGMVYATQEVSSIQKNILRNTANWFISHLNNTDETRELRKYYDFADFEASILRVQDVGFLRMKTLSNPFVVPVQVSRFGSR